jgi:hypothetical protein
MTVAVEGLVFDSLDLNPTSSSPWVMESLTINPPAKRPEWAQGGDTDGARLIRQPLRDTRTISFTLKTASASMDAALAAMAPLTAKVQEAEAKAANGQRGLPIVWTPANSTKSLTFYVMSGQMTEIPVTVESGYFANAMQTSWELVCEPLALGAESQVATVTSSAALIALEIPAQAGDVPAEGRLVIADGATQARRYACWGIESHDYDATTSLQLALASGLTVTGFGAASTTRAGSVATNVARLALLTQPVAVVGTTAVSHVGTFRVSARVHVDGPASLRFSYRQGSGALTQLSWVAAPTTGWCDIDLGVMTTTKAAAGLQLWGGQIDAQITSGATGPTTLDVDVVYLTPAGEGWGKSRAAYSYTAPVISALDSFSGLASGSGLSGRTATVGGTWLTSGVTTDFTGTSPSGGSASRATTATEATPRFAILGTTTYVDSEVSVLASAATVPASSTTDKTSAAIARYVSGNDYAWARLTWGTPTQFSIGVTVAGVDTTLAYAAKYGVPSTVAIRLLCFVSGRVIGMLVDAFGNPITLATSSGYLSGSHTDIATGGTIAIGKTGFTDQSNGSMALTRTYRAFTAGTPAAEPVAIYSGQTLEFRSDEYLQEDSTGTMYGQAPGRRGSRFLIPEGGDQGRKSRVAVKVRRNDVDTTTDLGVADSTTVTVFASPRYLNLPH